MYVVAVWQLKNNGNAEWMCDSGKGGQVVEQAAWKARPQTQQASGPSRRRRQPQAEERR